jgi:hypothetical protein
MKLSTRTVRLVVVLSGVALIAPLAAAQTVTPVTRANASLRVALQPPVVGLTGQTTITVSGVRVHALEARLEGATYASGRELPWRPLRSVGGVWRGTLPAPVLPGIYPVLLRTGTGTHSIGSRGSRLRVFNPGTAARPSFDRAIDVVRWWVGAVPHATLVAVKAWPLPAVDRRDARLHRLFVVAYSPPGDPDVGDRLGMFITVFRDRDGAPWRLLDASVLP